MHKKLRQQYQELQAKVRLNDASSSEEKKSLFSLVCNPYLRHQNIHYKMRLPNFCGGENIFANSAVPWPQVSREQVISKNLI